MHCLVRTIGCCALFGIAFSFSEVVNADDDLVFFEAKIRPALVEHCYKCHSGESKELKGALRLDLKAGWETGGESGEPAIIPGNPDESPFIKAVRHDADASAMPPNQSKLPQAVIDDLVAWVKRGAPDPRSGKLEITNIPADWKTLYRERLDWWSLKPVAEVEPPSVANESWVRNDVDRFILANQEEQGLKPSTEADRRVLARRLSFALTGLPPHPQMVESFLADESPTAYDDLVDSLLASPHFGERWARHWMDVVHYTDTHGYEWDVPAKNAWMYRDYLIRAYNDDIPYRQLIMEQLAGDLIEPRVNPENGLNESIIGPMALRLGERRHGDSAQTEGTTQEAISNMIDTIGKGFLGTTLACSQCHDHKLDAVPQTDYYALAGVLMSTRWGVRLADATDPNGPVIEELRRIKQGIRAELVKLWMASPNELAEKIKATPPDEKAAAAFPESLASFCRRSKSTPITAEEFKTERERRIAENATRLKLLADFTVDDPASANGWRWDGWGMKHGLVRDGEIVVTDEGDNALLQILPAGRWSHVWSQRLAGAVRSSLFDSRKPTTFSVGIAADKFAAQSLVVDQAFHSERMAFLNQPTPGWLTMTAGNLSTLEGSVDQKDRFLYLEIVTKSLNNYFPPRTGYGGVSEEEVIDPRSWVGITKIYGHPTGQPPLDELARFAPLFDNMNAQTEWPHRLANLLVASIERFRRNECNGNDVRLLNEALEQKWLANNVKATPQLAAMVAEYRDVEQRIQPERTVGSADDWNEGRNERLGIRGSYTDLGDEVPRGGVSLLGATPEREIPASTGRLELAQSIADENNPLTARVYVNRLWHYLFGEGLVRTPDDLGHLGQMPTHPELLDYLAARFVREGWSHKQMIKLLVTSSSWRQNSQPDPLAVELDPENRFWHHLPMRRLEAEEIRDAILVVSDRIDETLYGPPIEPFRSAEDHMKRLLIGPLDGHGRRSIYTEITLMEPPRFLALFNQPSPKYTTGRRDNTNVPDQALALLNDPFVVAMAEHWSTQLMTDGAVSATERAERMFVTAFARPPHPEETVRVVQLVERSAEIRKADSASLLECRSAWQDAAHAIFNLKEFIYVQ
ncbi:MAG: PSD1 and planctomycete cytochrome C domain-containing protein [Planctomycetota bacterium]|nr:PSD1 and planctomycete cytochrome C domain-containing protein [Planctomycetota bacterium]